MNKQAAEPITPKFNAQQKLNKVECLGMKYQQTDVVSPKSSIPQTSCFGNKGCTKYKMIDLSRCYDNFKCNQQDIRASDYLDLQSNHAAKKLRTQLSMVKTNKKSHTLKITTAIKKEKSVVVRYRKVDIGYLANRFLKCPTKSLDMLLQ